MMALLQAACWVETKVVMMVVKMADQKVDCWVYQLVVQLAAMLVEKLDYLKADLWVFL